MNSYYTNFIVDKTLKYSDIVYFCSQINRFEKYKELKEILKYANIAYLIENSIFEFTVIYVLNNKFNKKYFINFYNYQFNHVKFNLVNNPKLIHEIKINNLDPQLIGFLKPSELNEEKWKDIIERQKRIEDKMNNIPTSDVYKCHKCGMRKVITYQIQTRGLDEDATTFVKCCNCGNLWKE